VSYNTSVLTYSERYTLAAALPIIKTKNSITEQKLKHAFIKEKKGKKIMQYAIGL